jgi:hypothetical protein
MGFAGILQFGNPRYRNIFGNASSNSAKAPLS